MRLQSEGKIVKAGLEDNIARDVGHFIGDLVPDAMIFFGRGFFGRFDRMALDDEGVEVNHLDVVAKGFHHGVAGYTGGKRSDSSEDGTFRHGGRGSCIQTGLQCFVEGEL